MRRLRKSTALSIILAGIAMLAFFLFVISGSFIPLILALILLIISGYARKKESYEAYRDRYEERFGMTPDDEKPDDPAAAE
jgi:hypothetical protein